MIQLKENSSKKLEKSLICFCRLRDSVQAKVIALLSQAVRNMELPALVTEECG